MNNFTFDICCWISVYNDAVCCCLLLTKSSEAGLSELSGLAAKAGLSHIAELSADLALGWEHLGSSIGSAVEGADDGLAGHAQRRHGGGAILVAVVLLFVPSAAEAPDYYREDHCQEQAEARPDNDRSWWEFTSLLLASRASGQSLLGS